VKKTQVERDSSLWWILSQFSGRYPL